jgi:hypothetical protein
MALIIVFLALASIAVIALVSYIVCDYMMGRPKTIFADDFYDEEAEVTNESQPKLRTQQQQPFVVGKNEKHEIVVISRASPSSYDKNQDGDVDNDSVDEKKSMTLTSPNKQSGEEFGSSISVDSSEFVAIGAPGYGRTEDTNACGAVYVYKKETGKLVYTILPPKMTPGKRFGEHVAFTDNSVLAVKDGKGGVYNVSL